MANPLKGEVAFEAGGASYTLVLTTYGLAAAEKHLGEPLPPLMQRGEIGFNVILAVFYGGLLTRHDLSVREAGEVVDLLGFERAAGIMAEAFQLAFPQVTGGNPRKAKAAGTGRPS